MQKLKNAASTKPSTTPHAENKENADSGKKLYALVQWVGGDDDGKYSTDIPVEYIKHFDYTNFQKNLENSVDDDDFSYVVEWRDKKKQPKGGWKVYNCILRKVSSNKAVLERELKNYKGTTSLLKKFHDDEANDDDGKQENEQIKKDQRSASFIVDALTELLKSNRERDRKIEGLTASVSDLSRKLDMVVNVLNGEADAVRKIQDELSGVKYEIGVKGSGILVNHSHWSHINTRQTLGSLAVALVRALFPEEVLLRSSLKGGSCKIKKSNGSDVHEQNVALDPKILSAIYDHCEIKFPADYKKSSVGTAINQFLGKLRRESKGKAEKSMIRCQEEQEKE